VACTRPVTAGGGQRAAGGRRRGRGGDTGAGQPCGLLPRHPNRRRLSACFCSLCGPVALCISFAPSLLFAAESALKLQVDIILCPPYNLIVWEFDEGKMGKFKKIECNVEQCESVHLALVLSSAQTRSVHKQLENEGRGPKKTRNKRRKKKEKKHRRVENSANQTSPQPPPLSLPVLTLSSDRSFLLDSVCILPTQLSPIYTTLSTPTPN
jgi:hypothetical protein